MNNYLHYIFNASYFKLWGWLVPSSQRYSLLQWPGDIKDPNQEDDNGATNREQKINPTLNQQEVWYREH